MNTGFVSDAHASLPTFQDVVLQMRVRDWRTIEAILRDVKHLFAAHNKWADYGIAIPFKDFDLHHGERLIDFGGSTMPWYSVMTEGENTFKAYDLAFEKAVLRRLGRLSLVRLGYPKEPQYVEVEGIQNGVVVTYPAAVSEELLSMEDLVPIMWEFRRLPYGASEAYEIMATKFRRPVGIGTDDPDSPQACDAIDIYAELGAWLRGSTDEEHDTASISEQ
ncbi:hypothetical protein MBLNU13_g10849t1 [Cladosporium sp. NU13]